MDESLPKGKRDTKQPYLKLPRRTSAFFFEAKNDFYKQIVDIKIMKTPRLAEQSITLGGHDVPSLFELRRL